MARINGFSLAGSVEATPQWRLWRQMPLEWHLHDLLS
jgi:hypothetical protein